MIFTLKLKQVLRYFSNIKIYTKIKFYFEVDDEGWLLIKRNYETLNNLPENHMLHQ